MSYVNKKTRLFQENTDIKVTHVRSEGRMKNYLSATDTRAWCDIVEERRQHILEYQAKVRQGLCQDKIIPIEYIVQAIVAFKNEQIKQLAERIEYLEKMLDIYSQLNLTETQQAQLEKLVKDSGLEPYY